MAVQDLDRHPSLEGGMETDIDLGHTPSAKQGFDGYLGEREPKPLAQDHPRTSGGMDDDLIPGADRPTSFDRGEDAAIPLDLGLQAGPKLVYESTWVARAEELQDRFPDFQPVARLEFGQPNASQGQVLPEVARSAIVTLEDLRLDHENLPLRSSEGRILSQPHAVHCGRRRHGQHRIAVSRFQEDVSDLTDHGRPFLSRQYPSSGLPHSVRGAARTTRPVKYSMRIPQPTLLIGASLRTCQTGCHINWPPRSASRTPGRAWEPDLLLHSQ